MNRIATRLLSSSSYSTTRTTFASLLHFQQTTTGRHQVLTRPAILIRSKKITTKTGNSNSTSASAAYSTFNSANMTHQKSDEEWRAVLTPEQFRILRQKGTEMAYTGEYTKNKEEGVYACAGCQTPLYTSTTKFDACGWCSFYDAIPGAVGRHPDPDGHRVEIVCNACGGHLGHVFKGEGFGNPTDERHCVNSISLKFQEGDV
ncbi:Peptide methionine sulfoxide reductase B2, chloroplastic [Haplosporangium sp. Z 27]|nr:Peptide methionine sulfoxide reductase B2, chloroplastic [Haplosporangium sp. Z 27]